MTVRSMKTERPSPRFADIDIWEPGDVLEAMIGGQFAAVAAVRRRLTGHRAGRPGDGAWA